MKNHIYYDAQGQLTSWRADDSLKQANADGDTYHQLADDVLPCEDEAPVVQVGPGGEFARPADVDDAASMLGAVMLFAVFVGGVLCGAIFF